MNRCRITGEMQPPPSQITCEESLRRAKEYSANEVVPTQAGETSAALMEAAKTAAEPGPDATGNGAKPQDNQMAV